MQAWLWFLQNAEKITSRTLLVLVIIGFALRKIYWGWQYDELTKRCEEQARRYEGALESQARRTEYFMDLARKYAELARTSVEVAELLPVPPGTDEVPDAGVDQGENRNGG